MGLNADIQSLSPGALVELFELDASALPGGSIVRFHAGTNDVGSDIVWDGDTYTAFPVKAEGFEQTTQGSAPRPRFIVSNTTGMVGLLVRDLEDLIGAKVIRKRTLAQYLDGMPGADPTQHFADDTFIVERKVSENIEQIVFELASALDVHGLRLPARIIQASVCTWNDAAICTYSVGGVCDKTLDGAAGCKFHWGASAELPFGGFPGTSRIR